MTPLACIGGTATASEYDQVADGATTGISPKTGAPSALSAPAAAAADCNHSVDINVQILKEINNVSLPCVQCCVCNALDHAAVALKARVHVHMLLCIEGSVEFCSVH